MKKQELKQLISEIIDGKNYNSLLNYINDIRDELQQIDELINSINNVKSNILLQLESIEDLIQYNK